MTNTQTSLITVTSWGIAACAGTSAWARRGEVEKRLMLIPPSMLLPFTTYFKTSHCLLVATIPEGWCSPSCGKSSLGSVSMFEVILRLWSGLGTQGVWDFKSGWWHPYFPGWTADGNSKMCHSTPSSCWTLVSSLLFLLAYKTVIQLFRMKPLWEHEVGRHSPVTWADLKM